MKDSYNNLCVFNFGKRCYVIMKNNDRVMYFENVDGKFVMPITNFNLYDNQGKSLTLVNQHFFMDQLINRINIALKKGYLSSDSDIVDYLNDLKKGSENDNNLMGLFKGTFMGEVNEENFESNKRELLKYLDKFRFDTFVDYNNVSIFSGSLEKESTQSGNDVFQVNVINSNQDIEVLDSNLDELSDSVQEVGRQDIVDIIEDGASDFDSVSEVLENNMFDFTDVSSNDSNDFVNSNDYFGSFVNSNSQVQSSSLDVSGINSNDYFSQSGQADLSNAPIPVIDQVLDTNVSGINVGAHEVNDLNNQVIDNVNVFNETKTDFNVQQVDNQQIFDNLETNNDMNFSGGSQNISFATDNGVNLESQSFGDSKVNDSFNLLNNLGSEQNSNVSYIDEVKDRLNTKYNGSGNLGQSQFNNEIGIESLGFSPSNVTLDDGVISDKNDLPELEKMSSVPLGENKVDRTDKKSHLGIIIFMILLVVALCVLSFYLYNYVF